MFQKHKRLTFKVPNKLIMDDTLTFSARRLGAVLYSRRNALGTCRKSLIELAAFAGSSVVTVRKALDELDRAGYITVKRSYRYDSKLDRRVYDRNVYHCCLSFSGGYTLMPRDIFDNHSLTNSSFLVLLYLHVQAGNGWRAFPSINRMVRDLGMSHSAVCLALQVLKNVCDILVQNCVKQNRAFASNTYYILIVIRLQGASAPTDGRRVGQRRVLWSWIHIGKKRAVWGAGKAVQLPFLAYYNKSPVQVKQYVSPWRGSPKIIKLR